MYCIKETYKKDLHINKGDLEEDAIANTACGC